MSVNVDEKNEGLHGGGEGLHVGGPHGNVPIYAFKTIIFATQFQHCNYRFVHKTYLKLKTLQDL